MRPVLIIASMAIGFTASCGASKADAPANNLSVVASPPTAPVPHMAAPAAEQNVDTAPAPAGGQPTGLEGRFLKTTDYGKAMGTTGAYGAFAVAATEKSLTAFGAYDYPDQASAEDAAVEGCKRTLGSLRQEAVAERCAPAVYFYNACGATAGDDRGGWGTGWSSNSWQEACFKAEETCRRYAGDDCVASQYVCAPGGNRGTCDGNIRFEGGVMKVKGFDF